MNQKRPQSRYGSSKRKFNSSNTSTRRHTRNYDRRVQTKRVSQSLTREQKKQIIDVIIYIFKAIHHFHISIMSRIDEMFGMKMRP